MIRNAGQRRNQIKMPQDLRPAVYSAYDARAKSTVIAEEDETQHVFTTVATASVASILNKRGKLNKAGNAAHHRRSGTSFSAKNEIERRALMNEFGGFSSKKVLSAFHRQNQQIDEARKNSQASKAPPNEEFLKAQKQKLRDLMLRNAALENRRSLKHTLAKRM
jgi:hypothetical protein